MENTSRQRSMAVCQAGGAAQKERKDGGGPRRSLGRDGFRDAERKLSGQELEQHHTERVDVRRGARLLTGELFGRHVAQGSGRVPRQRIARSACSSSWWASPKSVITTRASSPSSGTSITFSVFRSR